ncbi:hypothetical protein GCM10009799_11880 [Nocardiopsis rhodophaea]|uniref:Uncharacterized protein n=1 Tax=Nocardiopsis rhodophaea TaxID=280238 RepID=A0ABN2SKZ7_9ACTN
MRSKAFTALTVFLVSMTALVYNTLPASALTTAGAMSMAAPSQTATADLAKALEQRAEAQLVKGEKADSYIAQARDAVSTTGTHLKEGESSKFSQGEVSRLADGTTLVVFPLTGGDLTSSALTVSFAPNGTTGSVYEMLLREISATSGSVEFWVDGLKQVDHIVKESQASTQGWSEFVDCLNNSGVAAWIVTAITIACSAICVGSAGTACIACIAAAAGTTGGTIGYCISEGW